MRIGFLHQSNDPYAEVRIKYFLSKRHEVYSITFPKKEKQEDIDGLIRYFLPNLYLNYIPFLKRIIYGWHIYKITKKSKLDILHVVNALNSFYLFCSQAKKNILENEGSDVLKTPKNFPIIKAYYKLFFKYAHGIIQDSKLVQNAAIHLGAENNKRFNKVIEIGVDFNIFNFEVRKRLVRNKYNINNSPIVFHSRRLSKVYDIDTIIKSVPIVKKELKNVKYIFTGFESELKKSTLKLIRKYEIMNTIIFCGRLNHDKEIKYYYSDADVVVSVPVSDSSPFSVYEAIACGTPVIVSDLPWLDGKFIRNKHLITVPVSNYNILANNIINTLIGNINIDFDSAYKVVYNNINKETENNKLEIFYQFLFNNIK